MHSQSLPAAARQLFHQKQRGGLRALLLPHGMAMTVCREIPFASSMFFIQPLMREWIHGHLNSPTPSASSSSSSHSLSTSSSSSAVSALLSSLRSFGCDALCGLLTAALACPISHVPSVLAAYQQSRQISVGHAFSELWAQGGVRELLRGFGARTISLAGTLTVVPLAIRTFDRLLSGGGESSHDHAV